MDEIQERFGAFQTTDRRPRLFEKLSQFFEAAQSSRLFVAIVVDGSFVTDKPAPGDIDLVLVLAPDHDLGAELRPHEYNLLSKRRVRKNFGFDVLVARDDSAELEEYVAFFQQVRGESALRKGVLEVRP